jgi:hypothetical protein
MLNLPSTLLTQFEACLRNRGVPKPQHALYMKWLRYYLDYCQKYHFPPAQRESLPHFLDKLQEKKQTQAQQQQAAEAISLYYELMRLGDSHHDLPAPKKDGPAGKAPAVSSPRPDSLPKETPTPPKASSAGKVPPQPPQKTVSSSNLAQPSTGVSWVTVYTRLASEIQVRPAIPGHVTCEPPSELAFPRSNQAGDTSTTGRAKTLWPQES